MRINEQEQQEYSVNVCGFSVYVTVSQYVFFFFNILFFVVVVVAILSPSWDSIEQAHTRNAHAYDFHLNFFNQI